MSSNTNIGNTPVNQGYVQLIHTGETGGIDGTLRTLYDGDGTASDLQIASNKVKVSTELYIGSKTATEFIQDIVGDMFTTGSYTNITTTYDDTNGNIDLSVAGGWTYLVGNPYPSALDVHEFIDDNIKMKKPGYPYYGL